MFFIVFSVDFKRMLSSAVSYLKPNKLKLSSNKRIAVALLAVSAAYILYRRLRRLEYGSTENKAVLITGCDSGLGYSLALHCATSEPSLVVFATLFNPDDPGLIFLKSVAEENKRIHLLSLDITNKESIQQAVNSVEKQLQEHNLELIGVVNNAGVMVFGEFEWLTERLIERQLSVNLMGTMSFTKAILPLVRRHKSRVINVTSHCGLSALPGLSVYSCTKAALNSWSDSLRVELAKFGVPVIKFVPGSFVSESRILARQGEFAAEMAEQMTPEARSVYGPYFDRYCSYLSKLPVALAPVKVKDAAVYRLMEEALFSKRPDTVYVNAPLRYRLYHFWFSVLPVPLRDRLVNIFVSMPSWHAQNTK